MSDIKAGISKYAMRYALRRRADGGAENPKPRPMDPDYIPKHQLVNPYHTTIDERGNLKNVPYFVYGAIPVRHADGSMTYKMPAKQ